MSRYNWRAQEEFYNPWRVKVAKRALGRFRVADYIVFLFDEATKEIVPIDGAPTDNQHRRYSTQRKAIDGAKRYAIQHKMPFVASRDYGEYDDFRKGPVLHCLACGQPWRKGHEFARGWERDVCPDCKRALAAYEAHYGEPETIMVAKNHVMAHPGNWYAYNYCLRGVLRGLIALIAPDSEVSSKEVHGRDGVILGAKSDGFRYPVWRFPVKPWQVEALKHVVDLINVALETAYQEGIKKGSNLLDKLVRGGMHPNEFSDVRMRKVKDED